MESPEQPGGQLVISSGAFFFGLDFRRQSGKTALDSTLGTTVVLFRYFNRGITNGQFLSSSPDTYTFKYRVDRYVHFI